MNDAAARRARWRHRQHRHRERERDGLIVLEVEVCGEELTAAMEAAGLLPLHALEDRAAISAAAGSVLAAWAVRTLAVTRD